MKRRQTKLHLDWDIWEWLKAEAAERRVSISALVREILLKEMKAK